MLALVPGPAERDAMEDTISAYGTLTTWLTAFTIGVVACPPQVIMFTLTASAFTSRLTGGQTYGPIAAGGRSTATMPASAYRGALAAWARALVASNTISRSGSWRSSQSTPSWLAARPIRASRCSPSDAGSTPTMYRGSTAPPRRSSLNIRSVPMLPGPTMAAVTLSLIVCLESKAGSHTAEPGERGREDVTGSRRHRGRDRARQHDVPRAENDPASADGGGQAGRRRPCRGGGRPALPPGRGSGCGGPPGRPARSPRRPPPGRGGRRARAGQ